MASTTSKSTTQAPNHAAHSDNKEEPKSVLVPEEDDEFQDFPAEDWDVENTDLPSGNTHLWEESWDDDNTNDDFSAQLREELKKVQDSSKKS